VKAASAWQAMQLAVVAPRKGSWHWVQDIRPAWWMLRSPGPQKDSGSRAEAHPNPMTSTSVVVNSTGYTEEGGGNVMGQNPP
jgi:hypothetical protein